MSEHDLIKQCQQQDPRCQKMLYERYAAKMLGVCRRYINNREDAEDILVEAMFKVFDHIESYQFAGSFEGWVRRIVVNEALMFLRKKRLLTVDADASELNTLEFSDPLSIEHDLMAADILKMLEKLPTGYRTIFNLYVIEGYKHIEIAELLGISINTSKSQLILAKEKLKKSLSK
ncbi:MAG: RNA polymerase sigma factor [Saprospiraceae bacterium]|nr:RNA polymerase sigma factor [Saprospiraceae bacterium]